MQRFAFGVLAVVFLLAAARVEAAGFQGLGFLPDMGFHSEARAVSANGSTVVGLNWAADYTFSEGFRWTEAGAMEGLGDLPGEVFSSNAQAVSHDASVIVGSSVSAFGAEAFRLTEADGMTGLGDLPGGRFSSRAAGVSADGSVVVGTGNYGPGAGPAPPTGEAFRWTELEEMEALGDVPGGSGVSRALGISADGSVIVGKGNAGASFQIEDLGVAFRWTAADGMVSLGFLPGGSDLSAATAVSSDGSVVVGFSSLGPLTLREAFRWTAPTGMVGLGYLNLVPHWNTSQASAVSADGSVVVGTSDGAAFLWTVDGEMQSLQSVLTDDLGLDLSGWWLEEATGISGDGTVIVGWGNNPSGQTEAWRAVIPEPSTLVGLLSLGAVGLVIYARQRRRRAAQGALTKRLVQLDDRAARLRSQLADRLKQNLPTAAGVSA